MNGIFVSYRRSDSQGEAGRLFDDLVKRFSEDSVFMDVAAIEAGRDFRRAIEEGVTKCGVLLVVIGREWLDAKDEHGMRRLDDPSDFVRIETASALKRDIPVIPVLVRGAQMPTAEQLPDDLKDLAYRNCIELTHARWRSDILLLIQALGRLLGSEGGTGALPSGATSVEQEASRKETPAKFGAGSSGIDAATQQRVARELALRIGPIATIVVKRAALQCNSLEELYSKVAQEIDSRDEREKFLREVAGGALASWSENLDPVAVIQPVEAPRAATHSAVTDRPSTTDRVPKQAAASSRKYLMVGGGAAVLIVVFVLAMRLAPSKGTDSSKPAEAAEKTQSQESVPGRAEAAPTPIVQTHQAPQAADAAERTPATRFRVPPDIARGLLISAVVPNYPELARQTKAKGEVVLNADISKEGTVERLSVKEGHPLLIKSALEAAKQMRYKPYMQNGEPVPISTEIVVRFSLTPQ